jgi:uncharacterized membrane protein YccC
MSQAERWLFAIKLFTAAMIAYAVSVQIGLTHNYWPIVTCCVLANPLTAGIRSKAAYRFVGTLCGGLVSLLLAGLFGSIPLLMIIGCGLCGTAAFSIAYLDRTPRAYGFQLFGLTLMIVVIGSVDHPEAMFDTALARLCEICLGIICTTTVDSIIVPRSLGPTIRRRLRAWLPDMETWIGGALRGQTNAMGAARDRVKVIADVTSLSALAGQLRYDPMISRYEGQLIFAIQRRMLRLVPLTAAIGVRLANVSDVERKQFLPRLEQAWRQARDGLSADSVGINLVIDMAELDPITPWRRLILQDVVELIQDALRLWTELCLLGHALDGNAALDVDLEKRVRDTVPFPLRADFHVALYIGSGVALTYAVLSLLWAATGWSQSPGTMLLATTAIAFFGGADQADRAIATFGKFATLSIVLAAMLNYGLLPLAHDFTSFVVIMGLFMLPFAAWAATNPLAILFPAIAVSTINLQGTYNPQDFGTFLNASAASLTGIFISFYCLKLVRSMGSQHVLARFAARAHGDVVALTRHATPEDRDAYLDRELDRIGQMNARLAAEAEADQSGRLLSRLRAGTNIAFLRNALTGMEGSICESSERLLETVRAEIGHETPSPQLLDEIDKTLTLVWQQSAAHALHPLLRGLVGLRLALFEHAPAWEPLA